MADIPASLQKIQIEEVGYRAAVSEATFNKMGASINAIVDDGIEPIGTVVQSILTESQFQAIKGNKWVRMSGQSIVGSDLNALTSITSLPNMIGNEAFIGQAGSEGSLGNFEASQNKSHNHNIQYKSRADESGPSVISARSELNNLNTNPNDGLARPFVSWDTSVYQMDNEGGTVARPNTYRMNFFIKINNQNT